MRSMLIITSWLFALNAQAFCFEEAGSRFDINPDLLKAIAYTESALNPNAINDKNSNGSADYGLMQINSSWFKRLAAMGITESDIKNDTCTNVLVGAWILASNFETSGETWLSVGAYNAGYRKTMEKARERYIATVKANLKIIENV